jgi:hypothetical protein
VLVENLDYVSEAAEALEAPGEIWLFRHDIGYDRHAQEWRFNGSNFHGLKFGGAIRNWVRMICAWLKYKYPQGPVCSA